MSNATTNYTLSQCPESEKVPFFNVVQILNIVIHCIHYIGIPANVFILIYCCVNKKALTTRSSEGISFIAAMAMLVSDCLFLVVYDIKLYIDDDTSNQEYSVQLLRSSVPWHIYFFFLGCSNHFSLYIVFIRYISISHPFKMKMFDSPWVLFIYMAGVIVVECVIHFLGIYHFKAKHCIRNHTVIRVVDPLWNKGKVTVIAGLSGYLLVMIIPGVLIFVLLLLLARTLKTYGANHPDARVQGQKFIVSLLIFAGKHTLLNLVPFTMSIVFQSMNGSKLTYARRICYLLINLHTATTWIIVLTIFPMYRRQLVRQITTWAGKICHPAKDSQLSGLPSGIYPSSSDSLTAQTK